MRRLLTLMHRHPASTLILLYAAAMAAGACWGRLA